MSETISSGGKTPKTLPTNDSDQNIKVTRFVAFTKIQGHDVTGKIRRFGHFAEEPFFFTIRLCFTGGYESRKKNRKHNKLSFFYVVSRVLDAELDRIGLALLRIRMALW